MAVPSLGHLAAALLLIGLVMLLCRARAIRRLLVKCVRCDSCHLVHLRDTVPRTPIASIEDQLHYACLYASCMLARSRIDT